MYLYPNRHSVIMIMIPLKIVFIDLIPYSGYFTWGLNFVVFVVGKQNTKISDTKIKCTV